MSNGNVKLPLVCVIGKDVAKLDDPVLAIEGVPVTIVMPAALKVLLLKSKVPFANDSWRVAPSVRLFCNTQVPPTPLNVHGKS